MNKKESEYHKINHLIVMREVLLGKLEGKKDVTAEVQENIEDVRFITDEIIKAVRSWKAKLRERGITEHIIFIYKGNNYLTKMIADTDEIVNNLGINFLRPPNPFFIPTSLPLKGIPAESVNQDLEILSEEKAQELKMMIESPFLKSTKNTQL